MQRYIDKIQKNIGNFLGWFILPFSILPISRSKIAVSSYYTRGYSDNPKAIVDELVKDADVSRYRIVCITDDGDDLPTAVIPVKPRSIKAAYHMRTAKIWVDNCRKSRYVRKRRGQYYMQTWHGCALKKIEVDVERSLEKYYIQSAMHDSRMCDLIISDSRHMTNIYRKSFWYEGEIATYGLPRADVLINNSSASKDAIRKSLNIPEEKRVITYAPTFRGNLSLSPYDINYAALQAAFAKKFGGEWVVLLRLHPNIAKKSQEIVRKYPSVMDVSGHHDPQDILLVSDALVTDYSSIMFDFMLTGRPGFLYANDIEDYMQDRSFYFDIKELPYSLATKNEELIKSVVAYDQNKQAKDIDDFFTRIGAVTNGNASQMAANRIRRWIEEG